MTFDELLVQVRELLQSKGRVTYRALKRRFDLDDEYLEDLKAELIEAERVATDEDGKVLVWIGAPLVQGPEFQVQHSSQLSAPSTQPPAAERRQLTVMFCDLVGSTALSTQLDPEELREVIQAYRETCAAVIRRFEGYLAKYIGDGLLVYFGYPLAHEDDARRALRAGLEIVEALQQLPFPTLQLPRSLQVRIGIHTGLVVAGEMGTKDHPEPLAIVGETPNLAARIQGQAAPNEVVISAATYRLIEGLFECEERGQPDLKGVSTPLTLYRVMREEEAQSWFEVVSRKGLMPLIGREHEFDLLRARWEQAKSGEGQVVLLSGEPGIGKSRLVEALKASVAQEGASCLELRCSPYHQNSALYPVIEYLQRMLRFQSGDTPEQKLQKLVQALGRMEQSDVHVIASVAKQSLSEKEIASSPPSPRNDISHLHDAVPLLAALLSLPHPEGYPAITLSPQKQKEKTHEALVAWLCAEAQQHAEIYA
jgi:class 3 adenylate cyclase